MSTLELAAAIAACIAALICARTRRWLTGFLILAALWVAALR